MGEIDVTNMKYTTIKQLMVKLRNSGYEPFIDTGNYINVYITY